MERIGTTFAKFEPVPGTDTMALHGISQSISTRHNCITVMSQYENKSLEELRFEDYRASGKIPYLFNCTFCGLKNEHTPIRSADNPSTESRSPFVPTNYSLFSGFGSTKNKPGFGNTGVIGSATSNDPSENQRIFGSADDNFQFGNKNIFGSAKNKASPGNMSVFGRSVDTLPFGKTTIFGFTENKLPAGDTVTLSDPFKIRNKTICAPADASLCNMQETNKNCSSYFASARMIRKSRRKIPDDFKQLDDANSVLNTKTKISHGNKDIVNFGSMEKCNFNFSSLKISGPQEEFGLRKSVSESYEEGVRAFMANFEGLIECPVCFRNLDSSLKQCENGHGICVSCSSNVEKCPTCQHAYLPNKPTLLCQILELLPKSCSFADKGCDKIFFDKKEEHETFCQFRPTSCRFEFCDWKGSVEEVIEHVKSCKKGSKNNRCEVYFPNGNMTQKYVFDKTQDASFYSAVIFENNLFWKHFNRDCSSKIISHKFYHISPSKPRQKFYLVVSFSKGEIEFKTCVAAAYETARDSEDGKGNEVSFFVPDEDLERFYDSKTKGYLYSQKIIVENICGEKKQV